MSKANDLTDGNPSTDEVDIRVSKDLRGLLRGLDPDRLGLVAFEQQVGDEWVTLTYADVVRQARAIGNALLQMGIGKGHRVGILGENRPEWPIAYLGIASVGATVVSLDIFWTDDEAGKVLRKCRPSAVFTSNRFCGAPIVVGREHARNGRLRAFVVNSGCSNVATGKRGITDAQTMVQSDHHRQYDAVRPIEERSVSQFGLVEGNIT